MFFWGEEIFMGGGKKYYAVIRGHRPGIYNKWHGPGGSEEQVRGFKNALYRGFGSLEDAEKWFINEQQPADEEVKDDVKPNPQRIAIYTDGGCKNNPGPGGYGAVIIEGNKRTEISQGYRLTTNNRMELLACITALKSLKGCGEVILHSDSQYVVNGITKGWAKKWRSNGWMRTNTEVAENADLWAELLAQCANRNVSFVWVRGHAGNIENERCDSLATQAAQKSDLVEDLGYTGKKLTL
jgi:ribonuclease HI